LGKNASNGKLALSVSWDFTLNCTQFAYKRRWKRSTSVDCEALYSVVNTAMAIEMTRRVSVLCLCHSVSINTVCDTQNLCTLHIIWQTHSKDIYFPNYLATFFSENKYFYRCQEKPYCFFKY